MSKRQSVTLSVFTFLAVTLGLLGAFSLPQLMQRDRAKVHRRIAEEFRAHRPDSSANALFKDLDALNMAPADEYALLGAKAAGAKTAGPRQRLEARLKQADVAMRPEVFQGIAAGLALALGAAGAWLVHPLGFLAGASVGAVLPFAWLSWRCAWRRKKFLGQLPGAFELMSRVIRAGQSVPQAFQAVAEAYEDPLRGEFGSCRHQQNLGLRPEVVFQEMAQRSGILELRIFAMAMLIQRQTGGNLSTVLERLATLVRNRLRLKQQVRALTAEGRLQGLTLVILPVIMFGVLFVINRPYASVLLDHKGLLAITVACMGVGILWIRRIVNFEG